MLAYSDGSQFHFAAELQSIWLVRWARGAGHPTPTLPTLFLPHCVKSSTSLFLPLCVKSSAWVIICVFHAHLLQCWHTETPGVWLISIICFFNWIFSLLYIFTCKQLAILWFLCFQVSSAINFKCSCRTITISS